MVLCASLFSQLVALFNKTQFYHLVKKHRAERYSKGYSSWDHFVAMLFCQLAQAKSLREICGGLACTMGKLKHLGMNEAPKKSTLSYANAHRPWQMFRDLFYETVSVCKMAAPKNLKFRFRNKLLSLDATTIAPTPMRIVIGRREPVFAALLGRRLAEEIVSGADKPHATKVAPLSFETARTAKKTRKQ